MTLRRLLLRNVFYHWRGNLAVFLGVALGTAVLTGALLVGDSLRGSLRDLTLKRLGWVDQALVGGRFLRAELAGQVPAAHASPAILLQGAVAKIPPESTESASHDPVNRVGKVAVWGVDGRFWSGTQPP